MSVWRLKAWAFIPLLTAGCGGARYATVVSAATSRVEEARALGADRLSPYDYYFAREHLERAELEASQARYESAIHLAHEAEEHASMAIVVAQKAQHASQ